MTSHTMRILGVVVNPPMQPPYGGADNYFFDPRDTPALLPDRNVVWGGRIAACINGWYFGDSNGFCNIGTGDPIRVDPKGFFIRVRNITVTPHTAAGWVFLRDWNTATAYWGMYFQPGVPITIDCGEGFDTGTTPYVELLAEAEVEIVYDIVQGRFP